ncbi:MAG: hypothetical protein FJX57_18785 [Alphaproteobacteria bacterium]|nr:hypothetical protein [Alphaproteobacteria bacterium]
MTADRAMELSSLLLREGVLRRDDTDHRLVSEEIGKDPVLKEAVRSRLAAVGYALVDDLGHLGVRIATDAESAWPTRNRMGLTSAHIRLIVYLWTQLVYREVVNLRRDLHSAAPAQSDLFDDADEGPFVSYRAVWNVFAERMSAHHLKGVFKTLKRQRFIRYDEKRDRIWADGALYILVDRNRMEEFVVELARRLGAGDPTKAVSDVVTGTTVAPETDEGENP